MKQSCPRNPVGFAGGGAVHFQKSFFGNVLIKTTAGHGGRWPAMPQ
jgi:hypothetical protein